MGMVQARGPLEDLTKGVNNVANMFGSQVSDEQRLGRCRPTPAASICFVASEGSVLKPAGCLLVVGIACSMSDCRLDYGAVRARWMLHVLLVAVPVFCSSSNLHRICTRQAAVVPWLYVLQCLLKDP